MYVCTYVCMHVYDIHAVYIYSICKVNVYTHIMHVCAYGCRYLIAQHHTQYICIFIYVYVYTSPPVVSVLYIQVLFLSMSFYFILFLSQQKIWSINPILGLFCCCPIPMYPFVVKTLSSVDKTLRRLVDIP